MIELCADTKYSTDANIHSGISTRLCEDQIQYYIPIWALLQRLFKDQLSTLAPFECIHGNLYIGCTDFLIERLTTWVLLESTVARYWLPLWVFQISLPSWGFRSRMFLCVSWRLHITAIDSFLRSGRPRVSTKRVSLHHSSVIVIVM